MKKIIISIGVFLLIISAIAFYISTHDNIRFKFEYEILNNEKNSNGKSIKVKIPTNNGIKFLNNNELDNFLDKGTGILYFGYSSCPWCRNIVPILIDTVKENKIDTINYVDIHKNDLKKSSVYEKLSFYLKENSKGEKVLAVPDVYVIKNGKVISHHIGTVDGYTNPYLGMNSKQKQELKDIYTDMIKEIK